MRMKPQRCFGYATAALPLSIFGDCLQKMKLRLFPLTKPQVRAAATAFDRYGKGIHSKARLNLSDCAAYALAKSMNAPLLFKGDDFVETDLQNCR
jgi:ribonuclease VapC